MDRKASILFFICVFAIVVTPAHAQTRTALKELRVATSTWSPYVDVKRRNKGLAVDLAVTILQRAGYTARVHIEKWPRTLDGARIGIYDIIAAAWHSTEREERFVFSEPYLFNEIKFIKRKNTRASFDTLEDLMPYRIGIVGGYAYDDAFDSATWLEKIPNNHVIQNLLSLVSGNIDLTLGDQWVIRYELSQYLTNSIKDLEFLPKPLTRKGLHIAISRSHPAHEKIAADFNRALKDMKDDGTFDKVLDGHINDLKHLTEQAL